MRSRRFALPSIPVIIALAIAAAPAKAEIASDGYSQVAYATVQTSYNRVDRGVSVTSFTDRILTAHNIERARWDVPALKWDSRLVQDAKAYALQLTKMGYLQHSNMAGRSDPQGENLWMGTRGAFSYEQMMNGFLDERRNYLAGALPNISKTGNWHDTGHYSQIVWRTTTSVGCAVASSRDFDYLVCRYSPAGNVWGKRADDHDRMATAAVAASWPGNTPEKQRLLMAYNFSDNW